MITNVGRVGAVAIIPEGVRAAIGRNMTAVRLKEQFQCTACFDNAIIEQIHEERN